MNTRRLGWIGWALLALFMIVAALAAGCTPTKVSGICAVQPIGQDENGVAYFRYSCRPEQ